MKEYSGIGSRQTPDEILQIIKDSAYRLASLGWILRSGGAPGADIAFQMGVEKYCTDNNIKPSTRQRIYIPWSGFQGLNENPQRGIIIQNNPEAAILAEQYHPRYKTLSSAAKKLMKRNGHQILGDDLQTPVKFVLCWTPDGAVQTTSKDTGGTGQAIRIAVANRVPVINLANKLDFMRVTDWLDNL